MTSEKIHNTQQLRQLLSLYYEGNTTPQQEAALTSYFCEHNDVDKEFEADRAMFLALSKVNNAKVPDDLETRILEATCAKTSKHIARPLWIRRIMETAAMLVGLVIAFSIINYNANSTAEIETPDVAKTETYDTLRSATPRDTTLLAAGYSQSQPSASAVDPYYEVTDPAEAAAIMRDVQALISNKMNRASQPVGEAIQTYNSINQKVKTILL